jgi:hypothetical protein
VSLRDRFGRRRRGAAPGDLHIDDPSYDDWEVVCDFEDLATAQAFRDSLAEAGIESVLTADWALDRYGRGDIALRVPPGSWSEAEELLSGLE